MLIKGVEPDVEESWIEWLCKRKGNEFLCQVDSMFIDEEKHIFQDKGRSLQFYKQALFMILDLEEKESDNELNKKDIEIQTKIKEEAVKLYAIIHQWFIQSSKGLNLMVILFIS